MSPAATTTTTTVPGCSRGRSRGGEDADNWERTWPHGEGSIQPDSTSLCLRVSYILCATLYQLHICEIITHSMLIVLCRNGGCVLCYLKSLCLSDWQSSPLDKMTKDIAQDVHCQHQGYIPVYVYTHCGISYARAVGCLHWWWFDVVSQAKRILQLLGGGLELDRSCCLHSSAQQCSCHHMCGRVHVSCSGAWHACMWLYTCKGLMERGYNYFLCHTLYSGIITGSML